MTAFPNAKVIALWEATLRHAIEGRFLMHGECDRCSHTAPLDAEALAKRFPANWRLLDLEKRLVCMRCYTAGRGYRSVSIRRTEIDGAEYDKAANDFARWQASGSKGPNPLSGVAKADPPTDNFRHGKT